MHPSICSYFQEKQARIASLYLPLYGLILDNMPRFFLRDIIPIFFTSSDQVRVIEGHAADEYCQFKLLFNNIWNKPNYQGSRDDLSVSGGVAGGVVTRHGNSVDASFSKEVLNSITGKKKKENIYEHSCLFV